MTIFNRKAPLLLFFGDVIVFSASLWISLFLRYLEIPTSLTLSEHIAPFSLLFIVWVLVFFISGLYDKQSVIFKSRLPSLLIQAQLVNVVVAVVFFYFDSIFGIAPKTNLFIYLLVSLALILWWRLSLYFMLIPKSREDAVLIGSGSEMEELKRHVNGNEEYNLRFVSSVDLANIDKIDFQHEVLSKVYSDDISVIAVDLHNDNVSSILPQLYNLIFSRVRFIDMHRVYEDVFDRVPLSLVKYNWFLENISTAPKFVYDAMKRLMDIILAAILAAISLVFYPFVAIAIKIEDRGPVFIFQDRVGRSNQPIRIAKFRSMSVAAQGSDGSSEAQSVTRVGSFIRRTRIDELPQLWNVLRGDLSLIGPRPELPQFVKLYEADIPFYNIRHLIKPGLSGWAQLYHKNPPKFSASHEDTRMKLSYDLFYVKNRSMLLDLNIALKTVKELIMRKGV